MQFRNTEGLRLRFPDVNRVLIVTVSLIFFRKGSIMHSGSMGKVWTILLCLVLVGLVAHQADAHTFNSYTRYSPEWPAMQM